MSSRMIGAVTAQAQSAVKRLSMVSARVLVPALLAVSACSTERPTATEIVKHEGVPARVFNPGDPSPFGVGINLWDPPSFATNPGWGLVTYADHENYATQLAKSGTKWVRMDIWGIGSVSDPVRVEYTINLAKSKGFSILANLKGGDKVPRDSAEWVSFVTDAVNRYGNDISYWEIWNEPNDPGQFHHYDGSPGTVADYVKLVRWAAPVIRPNGRVVGPSTGWNPFEASSQQWMSTVLGQVGQYLDVISVHVYREYGWKVVEWLHDYGPRSYYNFSQPLWLTEFGGFAEHTPPSQHNDVLNEVARYVHQNTGKVQRVFAWHHFGWGSTLNDTSLTEPKWRFALLRPTAVTRNSKGWPMFSGPVPRDGFWSYTKGLLYNCPQFATQCTSGVVPVHRWRSEGTSGHFYSLNANEVDGVWGWKQEMLNYFYVRPFSLGDPTSGIGLDTLFQCYSPDGHMLSRDRGCEGKPATSFERELGWVSVDSVPGMRSLWRLYHPGRTDYFTTACSHERAGAAAIGYGSATRLGYAWGGTCSSQRDVARFYNAGSGTHVYTLEQNELNGVPGWTKEHHSYFRLASAPQGSEVYPLYQCWSPDAHFLSRYEACWGGSFDRFLGFMSAGPSGTLVRLRLMYKASTTDYLAVTCTQHYNNAISAGYSEVETLGYVRPVPIAGCTY